MSFTNAVLQAARWFVIAVLFSVTDTSALARDNTDPVHIAVMLSSDQNRCFIPGVVTAQRHFTRARAAQINAQGGLAGRKIILKFFDHHRDVNVLKTQVNQALSDPALVAMIGISSSSRGSQVIEQIGRSGVPLVSGMSRGDVFAPYGNAFSLEPDVEDEIAAVRGFLQRTGLKRPAFVGFKNDLYSETYAKALMGDDFRDRSLWIPNNADGKLDTASGAQALAGVKAQDPGVIFLSIDSGPGSEFLIELVKANFEKPIFVVRGRINRMLSKLRRVSYNADMYQLGREQVPHVYNERLQQRIWQSPRARWIFEDERAPGAPQACKDEDDPRRIFDVRDPGNRRAIGRGAQYADVLEVLAKAAGTDTDGDIPALRERIIKGLEALRANRSIHRGLWQDWAFTPNRFAAQDILILRKAAKSADITLAPMQTRDGRQGPLDVPVLYAGVDVARIFQVDSNEKTFQAEFYLSLRNNSGFDVSDIEFTNAFRSPLSNEPVISVRRITGKGRLPEPDPGALRLQLRLYKITGKFYFDPNLRRFPFDRQRLSISMQPSNTARPFLIQPPPPALRKTTFDVDGWKLESEYVGLDRDIINVVGQEASSKYLIPITTFNFTWTAKRRATDHYLQVMVPLFILLLVTWLSTFIPEERLESVVAIQVTALLSSIALYLAVPKIEFDHATVSDVIFVVSYVAISLMLGMSILRTNLAAWKSERMAAVLGYTQIFALPVILILLGEYIVSQNSATGQSLLGELLGRVGMTG